MSRVFAASFVLASVVLLSAVSRADAQDGVLYELADASRFERGCESPCLCPNLRSDDLKGTFLLTEEGSDGSFKIFGIESIAWQLDLGGDLLEITGSGELRLAVQPAGTKQRLELKLNIAGEVLQFDSGIVEGSDELPLISGATRHSLGCRFTELELFATPVPRQPRGDARFVRGDCNGDGAVTVADAIITLDTVFAPPAAIACEDACDANDDGRIDSRDAVTLLNHLFARRPPAIARTLSWLRRRRHGRRSSALSRERRLRSVSASPTQSAGGGEAPPPPAPGPAAAPFSRRPGRPRRAAAPTPTRRAPLRCTAGRPRAGSRGARRGACASGARGRIDSPRRAARG